MDARELKDLLRYVKSAQFEEFELELEGLRLRVVRSRQPDEAAAAAPTYAPVQPLQAAPPLLAHAPVAQAPVAPPPSAEANTAEVAENKKDDGLVDLTSPMVGTFYAASKPGAPAFVSVGDRIEVGQTLCIIEAMKLMNEFDSEVAGTIVEVLPENGQPVEFGEVLFRIRPN